MTHPLKILFVASELSPLAKVGGLADVVGSLPIALTKHGVDVRIIIPKYTVIDESKYPSSLVEDALTVNLNGENKPVAIWQSRLPGSDVPIYLIENDEFFGARCIYYDTSAFVSQFVEIKRFLFFQLAVAQTLGAYGWTPDIVHCHDWHTGLIPALLKQRQPSEPAAPKPATVFTIHNLANQGKWNADEVLGFFGLTAEANPAFSLRDKDNDFNVIGQGIAGADAITTVSPQYAKEILTSEFGEGLESDLAKRQDRLSGILNGIDVDRFNPATDPLLPQRYSPGDWGKKAANKEALQKACGFTLEPNAPLLGFVGRLTDQKGMDLIGPVADQLVSLGCRLVILGTGLPEYEAMAKQIAQRHPRAISTTIGFDLKLAQLIYAGSDLFLMPSRFEPCGLGQMIAMRYGSVPIVRSVGGLKDTVPDYTLNPDQGRGFVFDQFDSSALLEATVRALRLYRDNPKAWSELGRRIMAIDFSWDRSSQEYLKLYQHSIESNKQQ